LEHSIKERKDLVFTDRVMGNTVFMLLDRHIGYDEDEPYLSGAQFADEMYYWKSLGYKIKVKINSIGGRIIDGWSIVDAEQECEAETINIGLAASMAGIALMFGTVGKRSAYDYSTCMIHAPKGGDSQFRKILTEQFKTLLKSKTKFTDSEIEDMMTSGKDYFFDASQMLEKGIVDEIITTNVKADMPAEASLKEIFAVYNSLNKTETKNEEMEIFNKIFGGKTEMESVANAVQLTQEAERLKKENETLKAEIASLKEKVTAAEKVTNAAKAKELVLEAVNAGKIENKPEVIASWEKMADADRESTKAILASIVLPKTTSVITGIDANNKAGLTYEELAQKDPKKLNEIAEKDPELFAKLQDEYIEKQRNKK
jgi:ATP-dependent protease ClpP protease subunit/cell division protein FtsB